MTAEAGCRYSAGLCSSPHRALHIKLPAPARGVRVAPSSSSASFAVLSPTPGPLPPTSCTHSEFRSLSRNNRSACR